MRYLAIDLGDKRTGLAVGDDETRIATPLGSIHTADAAERVRQIRQAIAAHGIDCLVIGLPLNMDGSEGPAARRARSFAEATGAELGLPVHLVDERLSSRGAEARLSERSLTRRARQARVDANAAAAILSDFLAAQDRP